MSGYSDLESGSTRSSNGRSVQMGGFDNKGRYNPWIQQQQNSNLLSTPSSSSSRPSQQQNSQISLFSLAKDALKWKSFSSVNLILIWVIFAFSLALDSQSSKPFTCTLFHLGALYQPSMKYDYEYHRLLFPLYLHLNFAHILANSIGLLLYSFTLEKAYGIKKYMIFYFICGLGGHLISGFKLINEISIGASSAIFGLFPLIMAYIWDHPDIPQSSKVRYMLFIGIGVLIDFIPTSQSTSSVSSDSTQNQTNSYAHFGGLLTGCLLTLIYTDRKEIPHEKKVKIAAMVVLVTMLTSFFFYNQFNSDIPLPILLELSCRTK